MRSTGTAKSTIRQVLFFCWLFCCLAEIRWSVCILKSYSIFLRVILKDGFRVVHILLVRMVKFKFLAQFPVDHIPHAFVFSLILSFFANPLYSLITWLSISSLSPHNLQSLFCCVLSIFTLTYFVLIAFFLLLLEEIPSHFLGFPFLATAKSSPMRFRLFVTWNKHTTAFFMSHLCFLVIVLVSLFNDTPTFLGYLIPNLSF